MSVRSADAGNELEGADAIAAGVAEGDRATAMLTPQWVASFHPFADNPCSEAGGSETPGTEFCSAWRRRPSETHRGLVLREVAGATANSGAARTAVIPSFASHS